MISPGFFFFSFLIFSSFRGVKGWKMTEDDKKNGTGGRRVTGQKVAQNDKKISLTYTWHLRNCSSYDCVFWYTCVKWWYLQHFFSFFQKSDFPAFSKFISEWQMEILRYTPPSSHVCDFYWLFLFFERLRSFSFIAREQ